MAGLIVIYIVGWFATSGWSVIYNTDRWKADGDAHGAICHGMFGVLWPLYVALGVPVAVLYGMGALATWAVRKATN